MVVFPKNFCLECVWFGGFAYFQFSIAGNRIAIKRLLRIIKKKLRRGRLREKKHQPGHGGRVPAGEGERQMMFYHTSGIVEIRTRTVPLNVVPYV